MTQDKHSLACTFHDDSAPSAPDQGKDASDHDTPPSPGKRRCVLLVDDDHSILNIGKQVLQHFGYAVVTAQNGEEAVRLYQDHFPAIDVVILDLNMPGMGGDDCLRKIMVIDPTSKVIMSSGSALPHLRKHFRRAGALYFLDKPYHIDDLIQTVRSVISSGLPRRRRRGSKPLPRNPIAH